MRNSSSLQPFVRAPLTWLSYTMLAYIAFVQSIFGPLMPFLRSELNLSYTSGGLLPAALAGGLILSGLCGDSLARRWGRRAVFWSGSIGLTTCALLLGSSHQFVGVFLAALGIGFGSSLTQVMIQALLADQHAEQRATAVTEANVAASFSTTLTPLVIGSLVHAEITWRAVLLLIVIFLTLIAAFFYREPIPNPGMTQSQSTTNGFYLPSSFWLYWMLLMLVVAVEMSLAVWGTEFLISAAGLRRADAALAFGVFPAAMLIGRLTGSRLTRDWSSPVLLRIALAVTLIGFPLFWLSRLAVLTILGLFISGLGIANLYPMALSIALGLAAGRTNEASARASLAVGSALLIVPLTLGQLADRIGIANAYGIVMVLVILAVAVVIINRLQTQRRVASQM